jgi:hypothetical protein
VAIGCWAFSGRLSPKGLPRSINVRRRGSFSGCTVMLQWPEGMATGWVNLIDDRGLAVSSALEPNTMQSCGHVGMSGTWCVVQTLESRASNRSRYSEDAL